MTASTNGDLYDSDWSYSFCGDGTADTSAPSLVLSTSCHGNPDLFALRLRQERPQETDHGVDVTPVIHGPLVYGVAVPVTVRASHHAESEYGAVETVKGPTVHLRKGHSHPPALTFARTRALGTPLAIEEPSGPRQLFAVHPLRLPGGSDT